MANRHLFIWTICIFLFVSFHTLAISPIIENPHPEPPVEFPPPPRPIIQDPPTQPNTNQPPPQEDSEPEDDNVNEVLDKLVDVIKEIVDAAIELTQSTTSANPPSPTISSDDDNDNGNQTSPTAASIITGPATGCASAQSVFSTCSLSYYASVTGTDFASAPASVQASCLCYTPASSASTSLFAASIFDGYASDCNAYLATLSLPDTTTVTPMSSGTGTVTAEVVVATNAKAQVGGLVGFCSKAGDVRAATGTGSPTPTVPISGTVELRVRGGLAVVFALCSLAIIELWVW